MRPVDVHQSLHAQGEVFQLKYLAQQADALLDGIDDLIAATKRRAPVRTKQPYALTRDAPGTPTNGKRDGSVPSGLNGTAVAKTSFLACAAASCRIK